MKKRTVLLMGLLGCLMFTTIQGCGQPAEEETVSVVEETVSESIEESTVPEETTVAQEETDTLEETEESLEEVTVPVETETTSEETETEVPTETETVEEVAITEMDATMYATTGVNVRESYSAESNKLRTVGIGEAVHVTGQTADGSWYRIEDTGSGEGFISAQYLSTEKPVIEQPVMEQSAPAETTPSASTGSAQAPNPGAQAVYDAINQGSSGQTNSNGGTAQVGKVTGGNESLFGNAKDGSNISSEEGYEGLHAAQ